MTSYAPSSAFPLILNSHKSHNKSISHLNVSLCNVYSIASHFFVKHSPSLSHFTRVLILPLDDLILLF